MQERIEEKKNRGERERQKKQRQDILNLKPQLTQTVNFFIDKIVFRNFLCKPISTFMEPIR